MKAERKLVLSKAFEKSYRRFTSKSHLLRAAVNRALIKLQADAFDPALRTHKLSGKLAAYLACSCGYDCRIIFAIEDDINDSSAEVIVLLDVGMHDAVY